MAITANLPLFTMKSFTEIAKNGFGVKYTVLTVETNMQEKGRRLTHYQVDIHLPYEVKTMRGYSSQHHMDAFAFAKRRARNWINKNPA